MSVYSNNSTSKNKIYFFQSKQILFSKLCHGLNIINNDSPYSANFKINNYITYGFKDSDYKISNSNKQVIINNVKYKSHLIGKYNVYNMSCAIIVLLQLGIEVKKIQKITSKLTAPPGRLEPLKYKSNYIFIDYAHTPDAVLKTIETVKYLKPNRIITIIGCGGNRDPYKRPIIGDIATSNSTYVIFTNDNPRFEKPEDIVNDIVKNLDNSNYEIVLNRAKAIKKGIQLLRENDILLVLGKGCESYQIIGKKKYPFSDYQQIKKYL